MYEEHVKRRGGMFMMMWYGGRCTKKRTVKKEWNYNKKEKYHKFILSIYHNKNSFTFRDYIWIQKLVQHHLKVFAMQMVKQCNTYKQAAKELGHLVTNEIWDHCFIVATSVCMPEMIQVTFSDFLINCGVDDVGMLFLNCVNDYNGSSTWCHAN